MYKIDTIFYFCDSQTEYDREHVNEGTAESPAGIDPRTIVFVRENGAIYKDGKLYGRMEDSTLLERIRTIIGNNPDYLPVASSSTLGAIKIGTGLQMTDSNVPGSKDKLTLDWDWLINAINNNADFRRKLEEVINSLPSGYADQWIKDKFTGYDQDTIPGLSTRITTENTTNTQQNTRLDAIESWKNAFNALYPTLEALATDAELLEKIQAIRDAINALKTEDIEGILAQVTDLYTKYRELNSSIATKINSTEYTTKIAEIEAAIRQMISTDQLTDLDARLRKLINDKRSESSDEIAAAKNDILSQLTKQWVINTISEVFADWEFIKGLTSDHYPMQWNDSLKSFIQIAIANMSNDENSAIWSIFQQKYNEILAKIESIRVLTDGEGAVSIDQLVAIIKSYIDTENFEAVNEMKTFWARIKSAYEDKEININDPEWLQKLEEILKNYETYEWAVAGFESRTSEELNLAQQFAQAQAKITELDESVSTLDSRASVLTSTATDLENRITTAESSITSNASAIETINGEITDLDGRVTATEEEITTLNSNAGLTSQAVTDLSNRVSTAENNLSAKANASDVYTKTDIDDKVSTINTDISSASTLAQEAKTDFSNWKNGDYSSFKTSTSNSLNSKASVSYVDGIKDDLQDLIDAIDVESGVTTSSDIQGWLNDGTLKLNGNTAAQLYSRIGDVESSISTKVTADDVNGIISSATIDADKIMIGDSTLFTRNYNVNNQYSTEFYSTTLSSYGMIGDVAVMLNAYAGKGTINVSKDTIIIGNIGSYDVHLTGMLAADLIMGGHGAFNTLHVDGGTIRNFYFGTGQTYAHLDDYGMHLALDYGILAGGPDDSTNTSKLEHLNIGGNLQISGDASVSNVSISGNVTTLVQGNTVKTSTCYIGLKDAAGATRYMCFVQGLFVGYTDERSSISDTTAVNQAENTVHNGIQQTYINEDT